MPSDSHLTPPRSAPTIRGVRPATPLDSALGFNIDRLAILFRRQLIRSLRAYGLTPEQWQVLAAVTTSRETELSQNDIAEITLKDRHAVSRMIDRMERDGWIVREPSARDSRALCIRPTAKAGREFEQVRKALFDGFAPLTSRMASGERRELLRLVKHMISIFEQA